jgi:lipoprotein-releasing system permease protein
MVGVGFLTAALIVVLSVFNGLENLLLSVYGTFDPELKIEATHGKSFSVNTDFLNRIKAVPGVSMVTEVIEDYAYVRYRDADMVITIKGMSDNFIDEARLQNHIDEGTLKFHDGGADYAIVGRGVSNVLRTSVEDDFDLLQIFYIKNIKPSAAMDPSRMYSRKAIKVGAVFSVEKNYDENFVFLPLEFTRDLLDYGDRRTSLEIKTGSPKQISKAKAGLEEILGDDFRVLTNEEQHSDIYRLLKIEKLFVFIAFSILITVGSINIFFSLMMLAIDKKKDISILSALGAGQKLIRSVFLTEGALIAFLGAVIGLVLGGTLCWAQDRFGLVSMGMANAVVQNYPVQMRPIDFINTSAVVVLATLLVSIYPASRASKFYAPELL